MLAVPDQLLHGPFRGADAVARGLLTPRQLRGASWRPLFPGVLVHRDVEVTHAVRALAAGSLVLPDSVVSGASAAVLWGVPLAGADDDVELTRWPGAHPVRVAGLRVRRADLSERTVVWHRGVHVTTREATAVRLAGALPPGAAVAAVDQLVHVAGADLDEIRWLAGSADGPNRRRARVACALADGLAQSPKETELRLLLHRSSSRARSPSTRCGSTGGSSRGWTSPGRHSGWRSSTTACGTATRASSPPTGPG